MRDGSAQHHKEFISLRAHLLAQFLSILAYAGETTSALSFLRARSSDPAVINKQSLTTVLLGLSILRGLEIIDYYNLRNKFPSLPTIADIFRNPIELFKIVRVLKGKKSRKFLRMHPEWRRETTQVLESLKHSIGSSARILSLPLLPFIVAFYYADNNRDKVFFIIQIINLF